MALDKENVKKYAIAMVMFVIGMLSVSISNLFGGFYCSIVAIEVVLLTLYVYSAFEVKEKSIFNIVDLALVGAVAFFEILFFVLNDIVGIDVYQKNNLNFLGVLVIISQLLCVLAIIYMSVYQVVSMRKTSVEIIDKSNSEISEPNNEEFEINNNLNTENNEEEQKEDPINDEIKTIAENNIKTEVPFMEEEK